MPSGVHYVASTSSLVDSRSPLVDSRSPFVDSPSLDEGAVDLIAKPRELFVSPQDVRHR